MTLTASDSGAGGLR